MEKTYYCLFTYPSSNRVHVMHDANDKVIVATEETKDLLEDIAFKLFNDGLIQNARVVCWTPSDYDVEFHNLVK